MQWENTKKKKMNDESNFVVYGLDPQNQRALL